jgi:hypothetical protein
MYSELYIMRYEDMQDYCDNIEELQDMRDEAKYELESFDKARAKEIYTSMAKKMWHVIIAPSCMGAKNMGLASKFACMLHGLRLFSNSWRMVKHLGTEALQNICVDQGVEAGFTTVPVVNANQLFPAWNDVDGVIADVPGTLPAVFEDGMISFQ